MIKIRSLRRWSALSTIRTATANIAILLYADGERRYIIAPKNLKVGQQVVSGSESPIATGNCMILAEIPVGMKVHCIEMRPDKGAQLARSAGTSAQFVALEGDFALLKLRSGEMRRVSANCRATIGEVGNQEKFLVKYGKAGAIRWRGRRPHVRGMVMNPVDHPMGGGEGRSKSNKEPRSPWGTPAKGFITRKKNKASNAMIVISRHKKR